jgi:hypothetical protein
MMKLHRLLIVALTLALPTAVLAGTYTWTDTSGDHQWTNSANWSPTSGYPKTTTDDALFNNTRIGNVILSADITVRFLYISQPTGTNIYDIAAGKTLTLTALRQAYLIAATNFAVIRGGTLRPLGLYVAFKDLTGGALHPRAKLTLTNTVFNTAAVTDLYLGHDSHNSGTAVGELDARFAQVRYGTTNDILKVPTLGVGYGIGGGRLLLPTAITNIEVNSFYLGGYRTVGTNSFIDLGKDPQLKTLRVRDHVQVGWGDFHWRDAADAPHSGFPPGLDVKVGIVSDPAYLYLGYVYDVPNVDVRWQGFSRFEGYFSALEVARCENREIVFGELDLSTLAPDKLIGDISAYNVATPVLRLGGHIKFPSAGVLKLPGSVTNLTFGTVDIGFFDLIHAPIYYSILHLGSNAQTRTFTALDSFRLGTGKFQYLNGAGTLQEGFPAGVAFRVGSRDRRALFQVGATCGQGAISQLGVGIESFEGWLSSFTVSRSINASGSYFITSTLDLRGAEVKALDITGDANIGHYVGALSSVYLPPCAMTCSNLTVGTPGSSTPSYDSKWYGRFYLTNTVVAVAKRTTVNQTGRIFAVLNGQSCGVDLATTNLTVATPHLTTFIYGRIDLTFADDPVSQTDDYFGLRLKGNAVAALQALHAASPSRLTWNISGLSTRNQASFGIHYDAARDLTVVGLLRIPKGTTLMVR